MLLQASLKLRHVQNNRAYFKTVIQCKGVYTGETWRGAEILLTSSLYIYDSPLRSAVEHMRHTWCRETRCTCIPSLTESKGHSSVGIKYAIKENEKENSCIRMLFYATINILAPRFIPDVYLSCIINTMLSPMILEYLLSQLIFSLFCNTETYLFSGYSYSLPFITCLTHTLSGQVHPRISVEAEAQRNS